MMKNKNKNIRLSIVVFIAIVAVACQPREKSLDSLQDSLISKGYTGEYTRPQGNIQFAAINLMGVEDFLIFSPVEQSQGFVIIRFRNNNEQTIREKLESIIVFLDTYNTTPQDNSGNSPDVTNILENQSLIHNDVILIWNQEEPADVSELIKSTF